MNLNIDLSYQVIFQSQSWYWYKNGFGDRTEDFWIGLTGLYK